jgi:hypothetical protein
VKNRRMPGRIRKSGRDHTDALVAWVLLIGTVSHCWTKSFAKVVNAYIQPPG